MKNTWIDEVENAVIIGGLDYYYEFYTFADSIMFARGYFHNDAEAVEFAKEKYPEQYEKNFELRCYDGKQATK